MKRGATALLVLAAIVFLALRIWGGEATWVGYAEAASEAAMVGGLADWFAVTALFKHPLGLPIPHTAIIPTRKDEIGRNLGEFVQDNFLDRDTLVTRLEDAGIGAKLGDWLSQPDNAALAANRAGEAVGSIVELLDDDEIQSGLEQLLVARVRAMPVAPLLGRALQYAMDGGHDKALLEGTVNGISSALDQHDESLRERIYKMSPAMVPKFVDDVVLDQVVDVAKRFLGELRADPDHEVRDIVDAKLHELSGTLQTSPEMIERGEKLKEDMLDHPDVRAWLGNLWMSMKQSLISESRNTDSELHAKIEAQFLQAGERLRDDAALQAKVDDWVVSATGFVAEQASDEVASLIASTVERWDAEETSDRIEQQVGRDLQFIRINGTVVGGVAGLVIHLIAQLVS